MFFFFFFFFFFFVWWGGGSILSDFLFAFNNSCLFKASLVGTYQKLEYLTLSYAVSVLSHLVFWVGCVLYVWQLLGIFSQVARYARVCFKYLPRDQ